MNPHRSNPPLGKPISAQMEIAAQARVRGLSQADAYREGYPTSVKWAPNTVEANAHKLFNDPRVKARVAELTERAASKAVLKLADILTEVRRIALFDPRKLYGRDGLPKPIHELDDDTAAAVAGIDVQLTWEGEGDKRKAVAATLKYRIADKNVAITNAMRHLGAFEKDNRQSNPLADLLERMRGNVVKPNPLAALPGGDDEEEPEGE